MDSTGTESGTDEYGTVLTQHYIQTQRDFEAICQHISSAERLALDTEFERRSTYYPVLALLQIATTTDSILIDPLEIDDWQPLRQLFAGDRLFVMHSCTEDLEIFRKYFQAQPAHLVDTQIACAFLGKGAALGYANMVLVLRGLEIDKSQARSNWLQRPLSDAQMRYAREDVRWLLGIYEQLEADLQARERRSWVVDECNRMRDRYLEEPAVEQVWLGIRGLSRLDRDARPLAYALADWRETLSRRLDKPRGWIMQDAGLLEIARKRPSDRKQLSRISGITATTLKRNAEALLALCNSDSLPQPASQPPPKLDSNQRKLLKRCRNLVRERAEQLDMAEHYIASKQDIIELIWRTERTAHKPLPLSQGWRYELIGRELEEMVSG